MQRVEKPWGYELHLRRSASTCFGARILRDNRKFTGVIHRGTILNEATRSYEVVLNIDSISSIVCRRRTLTVYRTACGVHPGLQIEQRQRIASIDWEIQNLAWADGCTQFCIHRIHDIGACNHCHVFFNLANFQCWI